MTCSCFCKISFFFHFSLRDENSFGTYLHCTSLFFFFKNNFFVREWFLLPCDAFALGAGSVIRFVGGFKLILGSTFSFNVTVIIN